jgi:hypothetical protein
MGAPSNTTVNEAGCRAEEVEPGIENVMGNAGKVEMPAIRGTAQFVQRDSLDDFKESPLRAE